MNPSLYEELCFTWKKKIAELVFENKMYRSLILNFDQTPLGFTSPSKVTFTEKNSQNVPVANIDDKRTITGTFTVSLDGQFLPIQLIYTGKTDKCHPTIKFPDGFDITHSSNYWSNEEAVISHLTKIVFPYIQRKRKELLLPNNTKALLIFDVFKGQTTPKVIDCLRKNNCLSIFIPSNHTNLFQPLDISVNKGTKRFLVEKYQDWYASQVTSQLERGFSPHDVKVDVKLTTVKPLHAAWVVQYYKKMQDSKSTIISGFRSALITETVLQAESLTWLSENPFDDIEIFNS